MKNLFLIITILIFQTDLFGQNTERIKHCLDSINTIVADLPKTTNFTDNSRFNLTYNKNFKKIKIIEQHFEKNTNETKSVQSVYTFNLSDLDPKFVLLEKSENSDYFYIQLLTINNEPKIKQQMFVKGKEAPASLQDRFSTDYWANEHLNKGKLIQTLFVSAIKEMLGKKAMLQTSTHANQLNELIIVTKDGKKHKFDIPMADPDEEPKYLFGYSDVLPSFQGSKDGDETLKKVGEYFKERIKQDKPKDRGTVYVQFIIDKTGNPTQLNVVRGVNEKLDQLALTYIEQMPKWKPGQHKGEKVLVTYMAAIKF